MSFLKWFAVSLVAVPTVTAFAATRILDPHFGAAGALYVGPTPVSGMVMNRISALAVQSDGKIVIGGRATDPTSADNTLGLPAVGRLNKDGSWDTTFADNGLFVLPYGTGSAPYGGEVHNVISTADGTILASGGTYDLDSANFRTCSLLMEFDASNGHLYPDFGGKGTGGTFCFDFAPSSDPLQPTHSEGIQITANDDIYLTTPSTNLSSGAVAHFTFGGTIDLAFGSGGVVDIPFRANLLNLQSNGQLLVTGGGDAISVTRLNAADGSMDMTYGSGGMFTVDSQAPNGVVSPTSAVLDSLGRLLISDNDITNAGPYAPYRFARVAADGTTDNSFNGSGQQPGAPGFAALSIGNTSNDFVVSAQTLPSGKILAAGSVNDATNGNTANVGLVRMNADSSFDTSFGDAAHPGWASVNIGATGANNFTTALAIDTSGYAFAATSTADTAGHSCPALIRIDAQNDGIFANGFETALAPLCPQ